MQHVVHSLAGLVTVLQAPNIALDERKAVLAFGGDAFPHLIQVAPWPVERFADSGGRRVQAHLYPAHLEHRATT